MKKCEGRGIKQQIAASIGNIIEDISELIVKMPCTGNWYEPEVPQELQDK